ncbi:MAG TPA: YciI family protein [Opitutaceae bacterium]|nr:YciI family protein [Opitutaceae bacterium]
MTQNTSKPVYLFLLRDSANLPDPSPEEMQQATQKWMAWIDRMKSRGQYLGGDRLEEQPARIVRGPRGQPNSDGPFIETKEIVGGYMLITADTFEQAVDIAKDCPGFEKGWTVEVRQLYPRSPGRP